jgi:mRNA-degrading endonuclease toxin of MazEF toxin-antitoxin module
VETVTTPRTEIAPWDIVRVDFSFADEATTRRRPALVIATPAATDAFSIIWVLMITSAAQGRWLTDVPISDLPRGGLSHPCVVRTSKITALDSRLATPIGDLAAIDRGGVAACLNELLATALAG